MLYKLLIVDDESPARLKLTQFIQRLDLKTELELAKNAREAIELLNRSSFDMLFLDIQMPQMDGFELIRTIGPENCPPVIFSTAHEQYALKAFEVHAIDYLLKPYSFDRFKLAVQRILNAKVSSNEVLVKMIQSLELQKPRAKVLWVNQGGKLIPLAIESIEYCESDGNYVLVHTSEHKYVLRQSLGDLHAKLAADQFIRVHRSFVVNQLNIKAIHPKSHGDMFAILKSGRKIPVSRRYKDQLMIG